MFLTKNNPASPIGFGNFTNEDTCDIISDHLNQYKSMRLTKFKQGSTKIYINRVYKRHKIFFKQMVTTNILEMIHLT